MEKGVLWNRNRTETSSHEWEDLGQLAIISILMYIQDLPLPAGLLPAVKALETINSYFLMAVALYMSVRLLLNLMVRIWEGDGE